MEMFSDANKIIELVNHYKNNPAPTEKLTGSNGILGNGWEDFFWDFIDMVDYKSDNSYVRVGKIIGRLIDFGIFDKSVVRKLEAATNYKRKFLWNAYEEKKEELNLPNVLSADSWSDASADVVSRGKDFYNQVLDNPKIISDMLKDYDYWESFLYSFNDFI